MEKGAEKATTLIEYAGEKQRAKTEPTSEDAKVRSKVYQNQTENYIMIDKKNFKKTDDKKYYLPM